MPSSARVLFLFAAVTPFASLAAQGYSTNWETFTASAAGTPCAGQDGFYIPAVAGSIDGNIHTYAGNTLGVPVNPNGGANFWGGLSAGGTAFARSQRALTLPGTKITVDYDVCCNYLGAVVPTNNIGSFSFQPSTNAIYVNLLAAYTPPIAFPPTTWDANVVTRGATPPGTVTTVLPDPAFQGLAMNVWHHWSVTIDLIAGTHDSFSITNGVTAVTTTHVPATPLLLPIAPGIGAPLPTDFRLFAGGTTAGNVFAVDNLRITYTATYTTFGTGCPGALGIPTLAAAPGSLPKLGTTLNVNLGNLPFGIGLMITGLSNTLLGGAIPLPFPLAGLGYPGCNLLVDPLLIDTVIGPGTSGTWSFVVPPNPAFAGFTFYNQGASLEAGTPMLAFSNGGTAQLGL
ncbi:MAG TPA: hypothetical protein VFD82_08745 [Planctomycetota bacterium]|nr:hypothetical protein [Planctomycetota bacterium]